MGIHGEVDDRARPEDQVGRIAVALVLPHRMPDGLVRQRILQFGRRRRDAVNEQRQVDRVCGVRLTVMQLPDDAQAVRLVSLPQRRREPVRRGEEREPERDPVHLRSAAQHIDRSARGELVGDVLGNPLPGDRGTAEAAGSAAPTRPAATLAGTRPARTAPAQGSGRTHWAVRRSSPRPADAPRSNPRTPIPRSPSP